MSYQPPQIARNHRWQSGQAMLEYYAIFPIAIFITIVALAALGDAVSSAFGKTITAMEVERVSCEVTTGSTVAELDGGHRIVLSSMVYDPDTDRTTMAFTVTSGTSPEISHWVLGIDKDAADRIVAESEEWSWTNADPWTGSRGIKFDTEYGTPGGGGNPNKKTEADTLVLTSWRAPRLWVDTENVDGATRFVFITLSGQVEFEEVEVTVKAGQQSSYGTITLPKTVIVDGDC